MSSIVMGKFENKNFYEELDLRYTEVGILLEDILLPPLPKISEVLSGSVEKFRAEELYMDMIGKFCIPILFPFDEENMEPKDKDEVAPTVRNIINDCNLEVKEYKTSNFIEINIPKYILLNFVDKIPKKTKFLLTFVGGGIQIDDIRVIGVKEYAELDEAATTTN